MAEARAIEKAMLQRSGFKQSAYAFLDRVASFPFILTSVVAMLTFRERLDEVPMLETVVTFNSIEMLGGHAFDPPIGLTGYNRMKERRPVRTKDGWLTMLPYSGDNWCAFFEAVSRPELIEELSVRDPVRRSCSAQVVGGLAARC